MKGKNWELAPYVIALLAALYFLFGPKPSAPQPEPAIPRAGEKPRTSTGPLDPTKPSDFLPDPKSGPDPNSKPDPKAAPKPE